MRLTPFLPSRRGFLGGGAAAACAVLTARKAESAPTRTVRATIHTAVETGVVRPELHGHFAEHLGSCIYGGLWVGRNSSIPNIGGYRKLAVDYLRELGIPVLRWPGGCFADDYHWRDGVGPPEKRPRTVNLWWGKYTEDNSFGTHEFIGLCRLIGAEPYLAGNVGSGTPRELRDWMEYSNFPSGSTLSDERIANGAREPFAVRYWGVGNENWGCGGSMTPEEYAAHYRRFATYIARRRDGFGGTAPYLIACGPSRNDPDWSRRFLQGMGRHLGFVNGFAMHYYSNGKSPATKFTADTMRDQLATFADLERGIVQQHGLLRGFDPEGRIGLLIDEWGVWDRMQPEDEKRYGRLWQQIPQRAAVAAALGLNVFHRHAGKLVMCNIAQIANVLHAMILTEGGRCVRTPAYWAFMLLKPHRGQTAVRVEAGTQDPLGLSISASRGARSLAVTLVNPRHDETMAAECALPGAAPAGAAARLLHHPDFNACNTFEQPDLITPRPHPVEAGRERIRVELPPVSVVTVEAKLA